MKIPNNINECFIELDSIFSKSPQELELFKKEEETTAVALAHHGIGRWIRNNWGFWTKTSKLYNTMNDMQLWHPDDMSSVILKSYHRHINNKEINLKEQIDHYINFWAEEEKVNGPIKRD